MQKNNFKANAPFSSCRNVAKQKSSFRNAAEQKVEDDRYATMLCVQEEAPGDKK